MKTLDYLFITTYNFYNKKKDSTPILMGCLVLAVLIFATLLSIDTLIGLLVKSQNLVMSKFMVLVILAASLVLLWKRYNNRDRILLLQKNLDEESINKKRIKIFIFIFYILIVILFPVSVGYMRHNLGWKI